MKEPKFVLRLVLLQERCWNLKILKKPYGKLLRSLLLEAMVKEHYKDMDFLHHLVQ
ncbi:unnamed protein product [Arabidopsis halleri]